MNFSCEILGFKKAAPIVNVLPTDPSEIGMFFCEIRFLRFLDTRVSYTKKNPTEGVTVNFPRKK